MSYKCSFVDEVLYGPEDVNEAIADLVGAGVAPFISADSYTPSDLNTLTASVVSSGVQLEGCKVTRVSDTVVSVAPGIIYFGNGLRLKVTAAHSITVPASKAITVYANYTTSTGKASLTYITSTITKSDYKIPLASISEDGTITDLREFAISKVTTLGTNAVYTIPEGAIVDLGYPGDEALVGIEDWDVAEIDLSNVNLNKFNYFLIEDPNDSGGAWQRIWNYKESDELYVKNINSESYHIKRQFNKLILRIDGVYWYSCLGDHNRLIEYFNEIRQYMKFV